MPTLSDARRWFKDQFSHDEQISGSPKPIIREAEKRLDKMNSAERTRTITHLRAYADLYYQGRHNENVPTEVQTKFQQMQQRIDRLNSVDKAGKLSSSMEAHRLNKLFWIHLAAPINNE
jgi:hypothetical protein